ncbi:unnamed protein product [Effrenium voratum]|nr:unnamed protein product [Effrenium voratum]
MRCSWGRWLSICILLSEVLTCMGWVALKKEGIVMLPAPLEINPAPKGGDTAFPRVIFSFKAVPKWEITLSESGSVFEILRLEAEPHYVEVEAATQVASSLPVRSFM